MKRRGLTLIELVLATGLLTVVVLAVFTLLDGSLALWRRSETRRSLSEQGAALLELLERDLRGLEPGARGDLLVDWVRFDTDGDGVGDQAWPRLRLVRQASVAELAARAQAGEAPLGPALIEVCWAVTPAGSEPDERAEGVLWRGERKLDEAGGISYFDPAFFGRDRRPRAGALEEVGGGLLWMGPLLATQTSIVHSEWKLGPELADAATSWDAWSRARPDALEHAWNEPGAGMPKAGERPALPRRLRVELELERPIDRRQRTRTTSFLAANDLSFQVDDAGRLPSGPDAHLKIGGEWMRVTSISGRRVSVQRAQRGTEARAHAPGALVHHGARFVREIPVELFREDWKL